MKRMLAVPAAVTLFAAAWLASPAHSNGDDLPFDHQVEVYRDASGDVAAFTVRLEQPFLAEEFEKSNYLRLRSDDERAYLIYPKETRFQQKHAEFYGRLRGSGTVTLTLAYETVSENLDGSRRVETREGTIEVEVPPVSPRDEAIGSAAIFQEWARHQNEHFAHLLTYYPHESFFQYCLLQSRARYGVEPPRLPVAMPDQSAVETDLYQWFTGSLSVHEALQRRTLSDGGGRPGDYTIHISTLQPPQVQSLDYEELLRKRIEEDGVEPQPQPIARLVPADQYLIHFQTFTTLSEAFDLATKWGDSLLRLYTIQAQDNRLESKFESQLCLQTGGLQELAAAGAIGEVAVTGSDPYLLEGTDLTVIVQVHQEDAFQKEAGDWIEEQQQNNPGMVSREFNYRGYKVEAHYTNDRVVSAFTIQHEDYVVYSNSHRAIRRVVDTLVGESPNLYESHDYAYVTTLLPPAEEEQSGYLFASEAFLIRMISPEAKIAQKRRRQCFNNLVMLNNASMFYRLEYGRSPSSLSDLIEGRFVDPEKIICPHGGAYTFDADHDTCACSLHNRLRYLTPNIELPVLQVSQEEQNQYQRYRQRFASFWQKLFNPFAVRLDMDRVVRIETCLLPTSNGSWYHAVQSIVHDQPLPIETESFAPSAVMSLVLVTGRERTAQWLRVIPGVSEVVEEDPTLTDLSWLGDRVSMHFCDGETVLEIDPARLKALNLPMLGNTPATQQAVIAALLTSLNLPVYFTVDVESQEKAERMMQQFSERIFLRDGSFAGFSTDIDAYRLPDYREHAIYVLSGRIYAATLRLHIALVGDQLVLATKPDILREVIDAAENPSEGPTRTAHALFRLNHEALDRLQDNVQLYWAEKMRLACHRNIISIYNFQRLYDVPIDFVDQLSEAKYGVRYYCPDGGSYHMDESGTQIVCSVHGNREHSRQNSDLSATSSFAQLLRSLDEIVAWLEYREENALIATIEIVRSQDEAPAN